MEIATVDSRGRILINKRLRRKYGISAGKKVVIIRHKDGLLVKPIDTSIDKLSKILAKIKWGRKAREQAEEWLLKNTHES